METSLTLNNGMDLPLLGLGTYRAENAELVEAIKDAVSVGYRLIDTASMYRNEEAVGKGIQDCGLPREELVITTKVWNNAQRLNAVEDAFERSLERLGLSYLDLYLVHWPVPGFSLETWKVLEKLNKEGRVRGIGVCNYDIPQLTELLEHCEIPPVLNQIEYHLLWDREDLRIFCREHGIAVQAYAPLARGEFFRHEVVSNLAEKYNRSIAQIGLRWLIQKEISVIPKSVQSERILQNAQIFDFELNEIDMQTLDGLNENFRCSKVPDDLVSP